jgi:hypothetical protein
MRVSQFLYGVVFSGLGSLAVSFVLLVVYTHLGPRYKLSETDEELARKAFYETLALVAAIGMLAFGLHDLTK